MLALGVDGEADVAVEVRLEVSTAETSGRERRRSETLLMGDLREAD